jgi:hypothetical protein
MTMRHATGIRSWATCSSLSSEVPNSPIFVRASRMECREAVSSQRDGGYAAAVDAHLPRETPPRLLPRLRIQTIRAGRQCSERTREDSSLEVVQKETVTNGDLQ